MSKIIEIEDDKVISQLKYYESKEFLSKSTAVWEKKLMEIASNDPLAKIIIPLIIQHIEEDTLNLEWMREQSERYHFNVNNLFQSYVQGYKNLPPEIKEEIIHPSYRELEPGQRIDNLQFSKDILEIIHPDYENKIKQIVINATKASNPSFKWLTPVSRKGQGDVASLNPEDIEKLLEDLKPIVNSLENTPSEENLNKLNEFMESHGLIKDRLEDLDKSNLITSIRGFPAVLGPPDLFIEYGSVATRIEWNSTPNKPNVYPLRYIVYKDGDIIDEDFWNSYPAGARPAYIENEMVDAETGKLETFEPLAIPTDDSVEVLLNDLPIGTHTYRIDIVNNLGNVINDDWGMPVTDTVIVTVADTQIFISHPEDYEYKVDTIGHNLSWTVYDKDSGTFRIFRTDNKGITQEITRGSWVPENPISIEIDGLQIGSYRYNIYVTDKSGNNAEDSVTVEVKKSLLHLNNEHKIINYYKYRIGLDWFECLDKKEFFAEPYFHICTTIPRYDPDDLKNIGRLESGDLYQVNSRVSHSMTIMTDQRLPISWQDGWILDNRQLYNTFTNLTIDMWEEDRSKEYVKDAISQSIDRYIEDLRNRISIAVRYAFDFQLITEIREKYPDDDVNSALSELMYERTEDSFIKLCVAVQKAYGNIDMIWSFVGLASGAIPFDSLISVAALINPQFLAAAIVWKVCGNEIIEFLKSLVSFDLDDILEALANIGIAIWNFFKNLFTDIAKAFESLKDFIDAIWAASNPDDHLDTCSLTINGTERVNSRGLLGIKPDGTLQENNIFEDADWFLGEANYWKVPMELANETRIRNGYGPTLENCSLLAKDNTGIFNFYQPYFVFQSNYSKYRVSYNVKRDLDGGKEIFGYTLIRSPSEFVAHQQRIYKKKGYHQKGPRYIKISICALDSLQIPYVRLRQKGGGFVAENLGIQHEFYLNSSQIPHGTEFELDIWWPYEEAISGYVTIEEEPLGNDLFFLYGYR